MDRVSSVMVRAALAWLLIGGAMGLVMTADPWLGGAWRVWLTPSHLHALFVGWFLQFALGVALWLLPRKRSPDAPMGYHEGRALAMVATLNVGLALRMLFEPWQRAGHDSTAISVGLAVSAALQGIAIGWMALHLWGRARPKPARPAADAAASSLVSSSSSSRRSGGDSR